MRIDNLQGMGALAKLGGTPAPDGKADGPGFTDILKNAIQEVQASQNRADDLITRMLAGEDIAPHEAIVAVEQANLTLQMALQIRSRFIEAFQEVSRTQI